MIHDLNENWFQNILRVYEKDDGLIVGKVIVENAVAAGNNFTSDVKRVAVEGFSFVDNLKIEFKKSLIVKQFVPNETVMEAYHTKELFKNEKLAYFEIIPELKKCTADGKLPLPECIYADECTIVLEDLSEIGFKSVDKRTGFNIQQIENILRKLAKLHAASMVMSRKNKTVFDTCKNLTDIIYGHENAMQKSQLMPLEMAKRVFEESEKCGKNDYILQFIDKLKQNCIGKQKELIGSDRNGRVINHGDLWGNNILMSDENEAMLIDLQIMRYTSSASDLSYFMYINMKPTVRREHFKRLLAIYLQTMNEEIVKVGLNMENELTIDWLVKEMDDFAIVGLVCGLWVLPVFYWDTEVLSMEDYTSEHQENPDWVWAKCNSAYKERVKEFFYEFIENNETINLFK